MGKKTYRSLNWWVDRQISGWTINKGTTLEGQGSKGRANPFFCASWGLSSRGFHGGFFGPPFPAVSEGVHLMTGKIQGVSGFSKIVQHFLWIFPGTFCFFLDFCIVIIDSNWLKLIFVCIYIYTYDICVYIYNYICYIYIYMVWCPQKRRKPINKLHGISKFPEAFCPSTCFLGPENHPLPRQGNWSNQYCAKSRVDIFFGRWIWASWPCNLSAIFLVSW